MVDPASPITILETPAYARWFAALRDPQAKARVLTRLRRLSLGNFGDSKALGSGLNEMRIDYGPGYRIYFARRGDTLVLLLTGGDKSRQRADIEQARALAALWDSE